MKSLTVEKSLGSLISIDKYHSALSISLPFSFPLTNFNRNHYCYDFRKGNFEKICYFISSFDWYSMIFQYNLDSTVNTLHKSIIDLIPRSHFKESTYPPWFTRDLKHILFLKKSLIIIDYCKFSLFCDKPK